MSTEEKVLFAIGAIALAAIIIWRNNGNIVVPAMTAGAGPSAAFTNMPPTVNAAFADTRPWGMVPPLTPMIRRSAGIAGIPENSGTGNCTGSRCG